MDRNYKNTFCAILLVAILVMSVGYSLLNTRLNISGTSSITSDFNIQVTGIREVTVFQKATTIDLDYTPTSASFTTDLKAPGDMALYEITIENKGSLSGYAYFPNRGNSPMLDYGRLENEYISIYIIGSSKNNYEAGADLITNNVIYLAPGEKIYAFAIIEFKEDATEIPDEKEFSHTFEFNFSQDVNSVAPPTEELGALLLRNNPIVSSGNGLYYGEDNYYEYKSDAAGNVNNYVSIDGKLWRIIKFTPFERYVDNSEYLLIESEDSIHNKVVYSGTPDNNGYYNDIYNSSLLEAYFTVGDDEEGWYGTVYPRDAIYGDYIVDNKIIGTIDGFGGFLSVELIMGASSSSSCAFANLSTGGCKSWLTNIGDTFLINRIFSNDTTNTGNVAYLEGGKIISVNPQNTNYGYFKAMGSIGQYCGSTDITVTNYETADGSKNNPYIINVSSMHDC